MPFIKNAISAIKKQINNVFSATSLNDLAALTKFIQRSSNRINAVDFVYLMSIDLVSNPLAPLTELCRRLFELNPNTRITPQSLSERINSKQCVAFFKSVFLMALKHDREKILSTLNSSLLSPFKRIFVEDSTQIQLHPKLSATFAGSGGSASPSSVKLDLVEDIKNAQILLIELHEGKKPDQSLSEKLVDFLKPNDLVLRDLGYFSLAVFAKIAAKKAFFLSRLLTSVHVYLSREKTEDFLDLSGYLNQKKYRDSQVIEFNAFLGSQHRLPIRLIAYRLPDAIINKRRREAKATAKKKGYAVSETHLQCLAFAIYITNVDASVWSAEVIGTIYRIRWQIELTFKRWKSLLHLDFCQGTDPQRIYTLIYARLIAIVLLHDFYLQAAYYADVLHQRELSPHKIYQWLIQKQRLANAIQHHNLLALWETFTLVVLSLCKQKRKRMTSLEMIQNKINFLDSFQNNFSTSTN